MNDPNDGTWTYEYDCGGNILNKKQYAYTTGTLGTVQQIVSYAYGDADWKDKLTRYNGVDIAYDAIGNPIQDGVWTYTWENGRQLRRMACDATIAEFVYNADGLRVQKTVNGVTTNYTLHGKNIVHMTKGNAELHFWYDAQNRPAIVEFNGTKYGYLYNLQGDVIGLIDSANTEVVRYTYDAWGKPLSVTGSLANTIGYYNPFRYRGYVYDVETGLYYLRSRYYNPSWGRFVNADGIIAFDGKKLVKSLFTYCLNIPTSRADNDGNDSYAIGSSFSGSVGASFSFSSGYCWDDQGNFGVYYSFVGSDYDVEQFVKTPNVGIGGIAASAALTYQTYSAKTVKDLAGPGTYVGGSKGIGGFSVGLDAINTLGKDETMASTVRDGRSPDGYQLSLGVGAGFEPTHLGTSDTYIMLIFDEGRYIFPWKRKLVNSFAPNAKQ